MFEITYKYTCAHCGQTKAYTYKIPANSPIPQPSLPDGWNVINGNYICNKHKIMITEVITSEA